VIGGDYSFLKEIIDISGKFIYVSRRNQRSKWLTSVHRGMRPFSSKINSPLDEEKFHKRQPFVLSASFLSPY
jgi:hypothetical protein